MSTKNQYLLMFNGNEGWKELPVAQLQKLADQAKAWVHGLMAQGKAKAAQALAREGATISGKTGRVISDGPFAESKEAIGGYLLIEAESIEEVIEIAKGSPSLQLGTNIEIRPLSNECPLDKFACQKAEEQLATANA
ncbi:MAG TPA: YciI family protein [Candidatus Angelobacter sp.]|nr:YciI family protein [Candidatus Angelobacter sp.]